jgi:hypothetical protein
VEVAIVVLRFPDVTQAGYIGDVGDETRQDPFVVYANQAGYIGVGMFESHVKVKNKHEKHPY